MKREVFTITNRSRHSVFKKWLSGITCRQLLLLPAMLLSVFMISCEAEEACVTLVNNRLNTGFFRINEDGTREEARFFYRQIRAVERDTAFFTQGQVLGAASLNLALNPGADVTTFVFDHTQGGGRDSLQLSYERNFRMISPECGLEVQYSNIRLLGHTFDSVRLITTEINEEIRPPRSIDLEIFSLQNCVNPPTNRYRVGFYSRDENGQIVPERVNFDTVRMVGSDSVFFRRNEAGFESIDLGLDRNANHTVFLFEWNENRIDTLRVSYRRTPNIISPYCEPPVSFSQLQVDYTSFGYANTLRAELPDNREGNDLAIFLESPCEIPEAIPYRLGFYRQDEQGGKELVQVAFDEIRVLGGGVAYSGDEEEGISSLDLFLNAEADTTTFLFRQGEVRDTLTVAYTSTPLPTGPVEYCEDYYRFTNLEIRAHTFEQAEGLTQELTENREGFDAEIYP